MACLVEYSGGPLDGRREYVPDPPPHERVFEECDGVRYDQCLNQDAPVATRKMVYCCVESIAEVAVKADEAPLLYVFAGWAN